MKKSIGLLSALVVTTTFIVNCQKAPDGKRRIKPTGSDAAAATETIAADKVKLPTNVCSKDLLDMYKSFGSLYTKATSKRVTENTTADEAKAMQTDLVNLLAKCNDIIPALNALGESENFSCFKDAGVKSESNALSKKQAQEWCNYAGQILEKDHNHPNEYSAAAKEAVKAKQEAKQLAEVEGKPWAITDAGLELFLNDNTNLINFIANGEIKKSSVDLDHALAASQTVCTVYKKSSGDGITDVSDLANEVGISAFTAADSDIIKGLDIEFKGKATLLPVVIKHKDGQGATSAPLVCLNMDSEKLTVDAVKKAFGSVITLKSTSATVTTQVTGGTSPAAVSTDNGDAASLTAKVSTVTTGGASVASPTAAVVTTGNGDAASQTGKVTLVPTAGVSAVVTTGNGDGASVTAKVTTVTTGGASVASPVAVVKVVSAEVAALKLKAERLDKEATDAEASLATAQAAYDAEKAKGDKADQAKLKKLEESLKDEKAVATNSRNAANTAKAEYDAAAENEDA